MAGAVCVPRVRGMLPPPPPPRYSGRMERRLYGRMGEELLVVRSSAVLSVGTESDAMAMLRVAFEDDVMRAQLMGVSDLGLVELETILYANGDTMRDDFQSSGLPADVVGTGANAFVRVNDTAVKRHLRFRVRFTAGHFDEESGDRLWRGVTDGAGTPLHAPRYAAVAQGLPPEPNGSPPHASNPRVVREDVLELMRLRGST